MNFIIQKITLKRGAIWPRECPSPWFDSIFVLPFENGAVWVLLLCLSLYPIVNKVACNLDSIAVNVLPCSRCLSIYELPLVIISVYKDLGAFTSHFIIYPLPLIAGAVFPGHQTLPITEPTSVLPIVGRRILVLEGSEFHFFLAVLEASLQNWVMGVYEDEFLWDWGHFAREGVHGVGENSICRWFIHWV